MKRNPLFDIAIDACRVDLTPRDGNAPNKFRLIPHGRFKAKDGRPHTEKGWLMDKHAADTVIAAAETQQDAFLTDYEHQTLEAEQNGKPAPAAGWFNTLEWLDDGLYVTDMEWTAAAKEAIENREYRYISPVFSYNKKTGRITAVKMAALVNYPAVDGLTDLTALAAARFQFNNAPEDTPVDEELLTLLGLDKEADADAAKTAITALKAKANQAESLQTEVAALKANPGTPDPAKYVPVATMTALKDEVAALRTQVNGKEVAELVDAGLADGRILPAQKQWATDLGESDLAALKSYLDTAQPIAALNGTQSGGQAPEATDENGLTEEEQAICKATGIDPEDYKKTKGGEA